MERSESRRELVWLGVFGVAFGYREAAKVAMLAAFILAVALTRSYNEKYA